MRFLSLFLVVILALSAQGFLSSDFSIDVEHGEVVPGEPVHFVVEITCSERGWLEGATYDVEIRQHGRVMVEDRWFVFFPGRNMSYEFDDVFLHGERPLVEVCIKAQEKRLWACEFKADEPVVYVEEMGDELPVKEIVVAVILLVLFVLSVVLIVRKHFILGIVGLLLTFGVILVSLVI